MGGLVIMKKLVLLALLAGSMLASCATAAKVAVKPAADPLAGILEDTEAHDELFGKTSIGGPKRAGDSTIIENSDIKLGIQYYEDGTDMAIRFVAAVNVELDGLKAVWHRHIYNDSGTEIRTTNTEHEVATVYTALNGGGETKELDISSYDGYNYFMVYAIRGIPLASASSYYINAFLEVGVDANGDDVFDTTPDYSRVLATTVDQTTRFTFDKAKFKAGYFGIKKTDDGFVTVSHDADCGLNHTEFEETPVVLEKDEGFAVINSQANAFHVLGYGNFKADKSKNCFVADGPFAKALVHTSCKFYVYDSSGNEEIAPVLEVTKELNLKPNDNWKKDDAHFAVYAVYASGTPFWVDLAKDGETGYYKATVSYFDPTRPMIFVRLKPSSADGYNSDNGGLNWGNKWNQTEDNEGSGIHMYYADHVGMNCFTVPSGVDVWDINIGTCATCWSTR